MIIKIVNIKSINQEGIKRYLKQLEKLICF